MEVFYINICGFISKYKFLYETQVLDNSHLRFKFQLPTSDSTQITETVGVLRYSSVVVNRQAIVGG